MIEVMFAVRKDGFKVTKKYAVFKLQSIFENVCFFDNVMFAVLLC